MLGILLAGLSGSSQLQAQSQSLYSTIEDEVQRAGFGIYSLSAISSFSNGREPIFDQSTGLITTGSINTLFSGASTSVGWRSRKSSNLHLVVRYSGSYYYSQSFPGSSGTIPGQRVSLSMSRKIGSKWTTTANVSGSMGTFSQLLLTPNGQQDLAELPGTPEEFQNALLGDTIEGSTLAPQDYVLYGDRLLNISLRLSAGYSVSTRLKFTVNAGGSRQQHLSGGSTANLIPESDNYSGGFGMGYTLSPRTSFNLNSSFSRSQSEFGSAPSASIQAGFSRHFTDHFFGRFSLGAGYLLPHGQGLNAIGLQQTEWTASGRVGYKILHQSFVASASRSASDSYGLGANATIVASVGWGLRPEGTDWAFNAGGSETRLEGGILGGNGYSANAGARRKLGSRFSFGISLGYGVYSSGGAVAAGFNSHARTETASLSLSWHPYLGHPDMDSTILASPTALP